MMLALFASGGFGLAVLDVLTQGGIAPRWVVVDSNEEEGSLRSISRAGEAIGAELVAWAEVASQPATPILDGARFGLLAWWPHLLRKPLIDRFEEGVLNLHPSLLPIGRGKDPNFWALRDRTPFGVTIHFVSAGLDAGDIAFQRELPIEWTDTGETLYRRSQAELLDLLRTAVPAIASGEIPRTPQDEARATLHRRRELDSASEIRLNAMYTGRSLLDLLRARTFPGFPGAWFVDGEHRYEVRIAIERVDDPAD